MKIIQTLCKDRVEARRLTHTVIHIDIIKNVLRILLLVHGHRPFRRSFTI